MGQVIIIPKTDQGRFQAIDRLSKTLRALDADKIWDVEVKERKSRRSDQQNKLLWSIYEEILDRGGEEMGGWTKEDLHEFFLITHFGSETKELFGKKRLVPLRRSSRLNKQEFSDFVETILRFMAERGICIPMPGDING